jgi:hypothetical protein
MLVCTCEKEDVVTSGPTVTGDHIGHNVLVDLPDVRKLIHVVNRGCDVEGFHLIAILSES